MSSLGRRETAQRFLEGLSTDELQYIAEYFGARVLDVRLRRMDGTRDQIARRVEQYESRRLVGGRGGVWRKPMGRCGSGGAGDSTHKMILLLEFLSLSELKRGPYSFSASAGAA